MAHCLNAGGMGRIDYETETMVVCATGDVTHALKAEGADASEDGTGRGVPVIAFNANAQPDEMEFDPHTSAPLTCSQRSAIAYMPARTLAAPHAVRRLTPVECERLQAFPDGYTQVPSRGKPAADGPRYKALGNSMCVNVMHWIGKEIDFAWRFF